jgi:pyrroline-5-carboxylate reductase
MKISFIGAGNMTQAFLRGLDGAFFEHEIWISNRSQTKLDRLHDLNIHLTLDNHEAVKDADILILAIKPQQMFDLLETIRDTIKPNAIIISLAAGLSVNQLEQWLFPDAKLIRFMPNTAITLGIGSIAICNNKNIDERELGFVKNLFETCGSLIDLDESKFELFIAASGSGIAFVYQIMESYVQVLKELGLDETQAKALIMDTFFAASSMAKINPDLDDLMNRVASKGGTTIEGLNVLRASHLEDILMDMCQKTIQRSQQLSEELQK